MKLQGERGIHRRYMKTGVGDHYPGAKLESYGVLNAPLRWIQSVGDGIIRQKSGVPVVRPVTRDWPQSIVGGSGRVRLWGGRERRE